MLDSCVYYYSSREHNIILSDYAQCTLFVMSVIIATLSRLHKYYFAGHRTDCSEAGI